MTGETKWPRGPYYFLEAKNTESDTNAGRPLTICDLATSSDLANVYSENDSTVATTREQAIALSHLFAAAPELYDACHIALNAFEKNHAIDWSVLSNALAKARGEQ